MTPYLKKILAPTNLSLCQSNIMEIIRWSQIEGKCGPPLLYGILLDFKLCLSTSQVGELKMGFQDIAVLPSRHSFYTLFQKKCSGGYVLRNAMS